MEYKLSEDDIAVIYKLTAPTQYYVVTDVTGNIISISHILPDVINNILVTTYSKVKGFLNGTLISSEYKVEGNDIVKKPIEIIPDWAHSRFKIIDSVEIDPDVTITWNKNGWQFELSNNVIAKYSLHFILHFYVVLEDNLDFLIRQLNVSFENGPVYIPFEHVLEADITKIKLVTTPVFSKYKLIVK